MPLCLVENIVFTEGGRGAPKEAPVATHGVPVAEYSMPQFLQAGLAPLWRTEESPGVYTLWHRKASATGTLRCQLFKKAMPFPAGGRSIPARRTVSSAISILVQHAGSLAGRVPLPLFHRVQEIRANRVEPASVPQSQCD